MFAHMIALFAVVAVALAADPTIPALASQYVVEDIALSMDTNAGYPPHYTEQDNAQYYDFEKLMTRVDVEKASYGTSLLLSSLPLLLL